MKRFTCALLLFLFSVPLFAQRDPGDTLLIKRPRYIGIFFGRVQFAQQVKPIFDAQPFPRLGEQTIKATVRDAYQAGLFFTYPFLHKMEWDAGIGVFSFDREQVKAYVSRISTYPDSSRVLSYCTWHDRHRLNVMEFRSYFSGQIAGNDDYTILAGAGGWIATQRMPYALNPGYVGLEANFTGYYRFHEKSFVQIHLSPGWMRNGYYINFGIAVCYQGMRTMRAHPKHYYVRTYDPEE